jgi:hypothetical protein
MFWVNFTNRVFGWEWVLVKTASSHLTRLVKKIDATEMPYVSIYGHVCLMNEDGSFRASPCYVESWEPLTWEKDQ